MSAHFLFRGLTIRNRLQHHRIAVGLLFEQLRRPASTVAAYSTRSEDIVSPSQSELAGEASKVKEPPQLRSFDNTGYSAWEDKKGEILHDIDSITLLTKEILHSQRYRDGERLTAEDEKAVVDNLLSYHPNADDKIGCGLDSIMVDRHPLFKGTRCLFIVRTDGGFTDFSYRKCLRAYIRSKYPSYAEKFLEEHFKPRG